MPAAELHLCDRCACIGVKIMLVLRQADGMVCVMGGGQFWRV